MQVVETGAEGLKRHFKVTIPAAEIDSRVAKRLQRLSQTVRMPGFRPGKAPIPLLKKQYGSSIFSEIIQEAINEGSRQAIEDHQLKPAMQPKVDLDPANVGEGRDLEFVLDVELLPVVPQIDLGALELTRLTATLDDDRVENAVRGLARARRTFKALAEPRPAATNDRVTIDFVGRVGGEVFEGGSGTGQTLVLGSGMMVPGFEEQLEGLEAGQARTVTVTFPDPYAAPNLAGKEAVFEVTLTAIEEPESTAIDDAWAQQLGLEDLATLKKTMTDRMAEEYKGVARGKMKRQLLDQLADRYQFEVPPGMVEMEFQAIWDQLKAEMTKAGQTFAPIAATDPSSGDVATEPNGDRPTEPNGDRPTEPHGDLARAEPNSEVEAREEYQKIAERRVRLGLLLAEIGNQNDIKVENNELQQAVLREAYRFPGQEKQVFEFYQKNPSAIEQLRAPLFEDKVVDFVFQLAKVEEREVGVEELLRQDAEDDDAAG